MLRTHAHIETRVVSHAYKDPYLQNFRARKFRQTRRFDQSPFASGAYKTREQRRGGPTFPVRLSAADRERQSEEAFIQGRRQHAAVESGINALENHGLARCPDHGLAGFKIYVALAVVARNLQILGHLMQQRAVQRQKRSVAIRKGLAAKRR